MKKVILFGASNCGIEFYRKYKNKLDIIAFCDNSETKVNTKLEGITIISPNELVNYPQCSIIITSIYYVEIKKQLLDMNINNHICLCYEVYEYEENKDLIPNVKEQVRNLYIKKKSSHLKDTYNIYTDNSGKEKDEHTIFIGMPVYNGERYIKYAIESIIKQTYRNWKLFISDNNSTDATYEICKQYEKQDTRIKVIRQNINIGMVRNFEYVLDKADTKYFLWSSHDDIWNKNFLLKNLNNLKFNNSAMSVGNSVIIDSFNRITYSYESYKRFQLENKKKQIEKFLIDPEVNGKANIFYSLFNLELCRDMFKNIFTGDEFTWGEDNAFIYACILRTKLVVQDEVLLYKRSVNDMDVKEKINKIVIDDSERLIFPFENAYEYVDKFLNASIGTPYFDLTYEIMFKRIDKYYSRVDFLFT
ncbi:glycosyltransferase [Clostridium felsineum]|uniref:Glycosyltransferase 2-like domain-containing protein n=1 Tax=Clostridium felsineum TaxID=36839 RepID=A0A1S8LVK7_9CLOT|nr:glycosyltransferase family 2 protein [Clostridium felsineum]URZ06301.1 hypothetical protein CLROS_016340 [Clostridium felsineum]URZ11336.1 hypothetical protein CROST_020530 [Clostridium felsineum]